MKIKCIKAFDSNNSIVGEIGIIITEGEFSCRDNCGTYGIQFDKSIIDGHNCSGKGEWGIVGM